MSSSSFAELRIVAYISGHGFGHAAQLSPVLDALKASLPHLRLFVRSPLPEEEIARRLNSPFVYLSGEIDVGVIQKNAIEEDLEATLHAARAFYLRFEEKVNRERELLSHLGADALISNISPLPFPAAADLGIPTVALASLDWHAIYSVLFPNEKGFLTVLEEAYSRCDLLIRPPLSMPMPIFPKRIDVDLVVARPGTPKGLEKQGEAVALVLFGGSNSPPFDLQALGKLKGWRFLIPRVEGKGMPSNVTPLELRPGERVQDYLAYADAVICKPGYGILAECWASKKPVVYIPRPGFPEYPFLANWLEDNAPSARLGLEDFRQGDWADALEKAMSSTRRYPDHKDGAKQAAAIIVKLLASWGKLNGKAQASNALPQALKP